MELDPVLESSDFATTCPVKRGKGVGAAIQALGQLNPMIFIKHSLDFLCHCFISIR
jgi:hypothetical protein